MRKPAAVYFIGGPMDLSKKMIPGNMPSTINVPEVVPFAHPQDVEGATYAVAKISIYRLYPTPVRDVFMGIHESVLRH